MGHRSKHEENTLEPPIVVTLGSTEVVTKNRREDEIKYSKEREGTVINDERRVSPPPNTFREGTAAYKPSNCSAD